MMVIHISNDRKDRMKWKAWDVHVNYISTQLWNIWKTRMNERIIVNREYKIPRGAVSGSTYNKYERFLAATTYSYKYLMQISAEFIVIYINIMLARVLARIWNLGA